MDHREVELKFRAADLEPVRERLLALGAENLGTAHEENLFFDDARGRLRSAGEILRLRQDQRCRLTFKSPLPDPRYKARREIEVEVSDFAATRALFEALGYQPSASYDKERETWRLEGTEVLLDRLSFGCFVEVEGEPAAIERVIGLLGLDRSEAITEGYLGLMARSTQSKR